MLRLRRSSSSPAGSATSSTCWRKRRLAEATLGWRFCVLPALAAAGDYSFWLGSSPDLVEEPSWRGWVFCQAQIYRFLPASRICNSSRRVRVVRSRFTCTRYCSSSRRSRSHGTAAPTLPSSSAKELTLTLSHKERVAKTYLPFLVVSLSLTSDNAPSFLPSCLRSLLRSWTHVHKSIRQSPGLAAWQAEFYH